MGTAGLCKATELFRGSPVHVVLVGGIVLLGAIAPNGAFAADVTPKCSQGAEEGCAEGKDGGFGITLTKSTRSVAGRTAGHRQAAANVVPASGTYVETLHVPTCTGTGRVPSVSFALRR